MLLKIGSHKQKNLFRNRQRNRFRLGVWLLPIIAVSLWFGYREVMSYIVKPEAVFVLGGAEERERFAAKLAQQDPELHIWVSGGSPHWYAERIFNNAGIERSRLHIDRSALDTVTNFTTLVDELQAENIDSVYLVTSDYHMRRARVIGEIVFGSRGIVLKPISVPSEKKTEPVSKCVRDGARALIWLTTGKKGAKLARY
ncbi:YdcF family protein [Oscillatoria salina]|uniref:YdcF family protein n=1 Tax=Oscillatoria salina TaxID=331517 RepID=UPI001CCA6EB6|nr:YdcF family protein [Oscillatoria salina]MBZ8180806.1 YdcF family protein [Oscillatoria salina IIICB1]